MMKLNNLKLSPQGLLEIFTGDPIYKQNYYIILGRSGPTGKTWLATKLKEAGFNVMELPEFIGELVRYNDDNNHIRFDPIDNTVFIVLNKLLERKPKKEITIILDDDVCSVNVMTNVRDGNGELASQSKHLLTDLEDGDKFDLRISQ